MRNTRTGRSASWLAALGAATLVSVLGACGGGDAGVGPNTPAPVGSLALAISGLPTGTAGAVTVTASGFSRTVTASSTLRDLTPGTYTVTAANVTAAALTYVPDPATQQVSVAAGSSSATASVAYVAQVTTGTIRLGVDGLPSGSAGWYTVRNGAGTSVRSGEVAQGAVELEDALAPGSYTVTWEDRVVADANSDSRTYKPNQATHALTLEASVTPVDGGVVYAIGTGEIALTISGLPTGERGYWTLRNSTGAEVKWGSVLEDATFPVTNLTPGSYTITWDDASILDANVNRRTYGPASRTRTLTVTASLTPVPDSVVYALRTGAVALGVTGLPDGESGSYTIRNSEGEAIRWGSVRQGAVKEETDLVPGTYFLTWEDESVVDGGGNWHTYAPTSASRTLTITASMTPSDGAVSYAIATGVIALTVAGLPDGASGYVEIRDGAGAWAGAGSVLQGATRRVSDLAPGVYTVTWSDSGDATPAPRTTTVTVAATTTPVAVNVTYSAP